MVYVTTPVADCACGALLGQRFTDVSHVSVTNCPLLGQSSVSDIYTLEMSLWHHEMLTQCWFNAGPASATLTQHWTTIGWTFRVHWHHIRLASMWIYHTLSRRRCLGLPVDQTIYLGPVQIQGLVLFEPFLNKYPVIALIAINPKA